MFDHHGVDVGLFAGGPVTAFADVDDLDAGADQGDDAIGDEVIVQNHIGGSKSCDGLLGQ